MMKALLAVLVLSLPVLAQAQSGVCNFSKEITDHRIVTAEGCSTKLCMHVVECEGGARESVTCAAKNNSCDGYTADDCRANSKRLISKAPFARTTFPVKKPSVEPAPKEPNQGGGR